MEQMRRGHADQQAPNGAAHRDHQVEMREITRMRLHMRQLAVAYHAGSEQPERVQHDGKDNAGKVQLPKEGQLYAGYIEIAAESVPHGGQSHHEQFQVGRAPVPPAAFKVRSHGERPRGMRWRSETR